MCVSWLISRWSALASLIFSLALALPPIALASADEPFAAELQRFFRPEELFQY